uniref:Uncharacterized protein n=1 Tax=Lepeophtheirus salmonis TaxID=72036 RepID=A0A0K2VGQ2_LEPSM
MRKLLFFLSEVGLSDACMTCTLRHASHRPSLSTQTSPLPWLSWTAGDPRR